MATNSDVYCVHLLHQRKDLLEPTAELINDEWPRSLTARLLSISEGIDTLPCSIVLTRPAEKDAAACGGGLEEVIGHARLMPAAGNKGAALVETVVVARKLRGCGLGRRIMAEAERHTADVGYSSMHLSTHDKLGFYTHLGYVRGPKVSALKKCVANLSDEEAQSLITELETGSTCTAVVLPSSDSTPSATDNSQQLPPVTPPTLAAAPPPPPPPPTILKSSQFTETETLHWLMKQLSTTIAHSTTTSINQ